MRRTRNQNDVIAIDDITDGVRLQDGSMALVLRADREALIAKGYTGRWFLSKSGQGLAHVRMQGHRTVLTPARLILDAKPDEGIRYANGSRLDLRRENIKAGPRRGGMRQRELGRGCHLGSKVKGAV